MSSDQQCQCRKGSRYLDTGEAPLRVGKERLQIVTEQEAGEGRGRRYTGSEGG
jgi:hypothetical protein